MFKWIAGWFRGVRVPDWIRAEIDRTEMSLLQAEDELLMAQQRVRTLKARLARLNADPRKDTYHISARAQRKAAENSKKQQEEIARALKDRGGQVEEAAHLKLFPRHRQP